MGVQWVYWSWNPHYMRDFRNQLLRGRFKWMSSPSTFPRSIFNLSWLPTEHNTYWRPVHPQASPPHNRPFEEGWYNHFVVLLHTSSKCFLPLISLHFKPNILISNLDAKRFRFIHHCLTFSRFLCIIKGTLKRRDHLNESKFFWCSCERCKDPTELGTHASTLLCPKCTNGFILSIEPLNQDADWK